jgi:hypothetical protein
MTMQEKYGVECECKGGSGTPPEGSDLTKVASTDSVECPMCGIEWKGLQEEQG